VIRNLDVNKMAEYKSISTHIYIGLPDAQKRYTIKNKVKTVFFRRFFGYVINQWSNSNASNAHFTVIFLKSFFF